VTREAQLAGGVEPSDGLRFVMKGRAVLVDAWACLGRCCLDRAVVERHGRQRKVRKGALAERTETRTKIAAGSIRIPTATLDYYSPHGEYGELTVPRYDESRSCPTAAGDIRSSTGSMSPCQDPAYRSYERILTWRRQSAHRLKPLKKVTYYVNSGPALCGLELYLRM
jgi:hypothetical protein